ncbi:prolipoprotein diacylglyceryl transferase [Cellulomonas flavigena DSM 20109]|uniref:Prolipoprotein diacylglyceryl transferase n=1 Tax=Cellulomonas flavigena (strain ATCC 482 / DSM 20109 / BCRC 11376 / JCM 18109 / NBRC 3775 / NCIMB 8073 / NRS 134) TaxID=446466 RepID=D5UE70_CELFN|nr:prolipoprotein diacylglyceryl transferase [Cellulomonas flavigena]ADG76546.1 prolipoprotein diacylglyceryl transferase [Cellulomonas flavigena DSM 20109]
MQPVLFTVLGVEVQTYGVSKVLAALLAAYLLGRAFTARGLKRESAYDLVMSATFWGFIGAKVYYLFEQLPTVSLHDFGGMGFTWYGGLLGGVAAALVVIRRHRLPLEVVAGATAVPLTLAYGVGRLGCLLSGDGTYGEPSSLPWAMTFPDGAVPTDVPVHPTPAYEAIAAVLIAWGLWALGRHATGQTVFGAYLALSGVARLLVEELRTNDAVVAGLTQPQLWSLLSVAVGIVLVVRSRTTLAPITPTPDPVGAGLVPREP